MNLKKNIMFLLLFLGIALSMDYSQDEFDAALETLETDSVIVELCREYIDNATDIDVIRMAQNRWKRTDEESVDVYFTELLEKNPGSPKYTYLLGRIKNDPFEQIKLGRTVIELAPDWAYGYRLVFAPYVSKLFDKRGSAADKKTLRGELPNDETSFQKFLELEGDTDISLKFLNSYQKYKGQWVDVIETLDRARKIEADWVNEYEYAKAYCRLGEFDKTLEKIGLHVDDKIEAGDYQPDERQAKIDAFYTNLMKYLKYYDDVIVYIHAQPDYKSNKKSLFMLARVHALKEESDLAFDYLFQAADAGWDKTESTEKTRDLKPLQDDPRWETLIEKIQQVWEAGVEQREKETLKNKIEKDAFDWILTDVNGDTIRVADYRGEVVILDFWATWCGPCLSAMPVIDEWCKTKKPENVHVFSVNIWERDLEKAIKVVKEKDYAMKIVFGTQVVADKFGIESIPYICAIDQEGNIRFEETGYSQGLNEMLTWWVSDLLE